MTGAEVRATLAELGMTQRAFAARFALSEVVVSRWVNGVRPVPPWVAGVLALLRERAVEVHAAPSSPSSSLTARTRRTRMSRAGNSTCIDLGEALIGRGLSRVSARG